MSSAKQRGYDINLFRSNNRWIAGVCGGIAKNMGWPPIGVRLAMLFIATISGTLAIVAYVAAIFLIANEDERTNNFSFQSSPRGKASQAQPNLRDKVMSKEDITQSRIQQISQRLKQADSRIRAMEEHVTSKKFRFDQELNRS